MNTLLESSVPAPAIWTGSENQIINLNSRYYSVLYECPELLSTELLDNPVRLQEIYDLRLEVWERSGKSEMVNKQLFPKGWNDELDPTAFHWVVTNDQYKIIAAARLNIFQSWSDFPYRTSVGHLSLPAVGPFAFFSRLVVHPQYQNLKLSRKLFDSRTRYCQEKSIGWSQVFINNPNIMNLFEKSGYNNIGQASVSYHEALHPHSVNVFVKENNC